MLLEEYRGSKEEKVKKDISSPLWGLYETSNTTETRLRFPSDRRLTSWLSFRRGRGFKLRTIEDKPGCEN